MPKSITSGIAIPCPHHQSHHRILFLSFQIKKQRITIRHDIVIPTRLHRHANRSNTSLTAPLEPHHRPAQNLRSSLFDQTSTTIATSTTDPPRRRLQAQTRQRHPSPPPNPPQPPPLRRKLPAGTPIQVAPPPTRDPVALHRRPADEQVQAARRGDPQPVVRGERGHGQEGGST